MSSQILKDGTFAADEWTQVTSDEPIPEAAAIVIPFARWCAERDSLSATSAKLGISLANTDDVQLLAPDLSRIDLITVDFPAAVDGRGYSQARILRDRLGFKGELRAVGEVLVDQLYFMSRCGFNAFQLADGQQSSCVNRYFTPFTVQYQ